MITRTAAWLLWTLGNRRLRHGFCPGCYSSPPRPECPLCEGELQYGPFDPETSRLLGTRWDAMYRVIR